MSLYQPLKTGLFFAFQCNEKLNVFIQRTSLIALVKYSIVYFLNASWLAIHNNSGNFWTQLKYKLRIKLA